MDEKNIIELNSLLLTLGSQTERISDEYSEFYFPDKAKGYLLSEHGWNHEL